MGTNLKYYGAGRTSTSTNKALSYSEIHIQFYPDGADTFWPWKQSPSEQENTSGFYLTSFSLLPAPNFLEYQGSFQSCFHFADTYRMEQTIGGVHIPGDSHAYTSHQHNGFHMSASNTGSAGEADHPITLRIWKVNWMISIIRIHIELHHVFSGFSLPQELQGGAGCQFSPGPEENIFFQVGSFERSLSHISSVYTET